MPVYVVKLRERWDRTVLVESDNPEEALKDSLQGVYIDAETAGSAFEYICTIPPELHRDVRVSMPEEIAMLERAEELHEIMGEDVDMDKLNPPRPDKGPVPIKNDMEVSVIKEGVKSGEKVKKEGEVIASEDNKKTRTIN